MKMFSKMIIPSLCLIPLSLFGADKLAQSQTPPGGLAVKNVPLFVVLGFDDNGYSGLAGSGGTGGLDFTSSYINSKTNPAGKGNAATFDGKKATCTYYVRGTAIADNDFEDVKYVRQALNSAYLAGNEIGNHTMHHGHGVDIDWDKTPAQRTDKYDLPKWIKEITDANTEFTKPYVAGSSDPKHGLGVNPKDIVGFRTPFLEYNDAAFQAMSKLGFKYDCSIEEGGEDDMEVQNRYWPYTLDNGSLGDAAESMNVYELKTPVVGKHAGLWEFGCPKAIVPADADCEKYGVKPGLRDRLNKVRDYIDPENGQITGLDWNLWFDFFVTKEEFVAIWKYTFDQHLDGNRSPLTFGYHSDIYSDKYDKNDLDDIEEGMTVHANAEQRREALKEVIDYANSKADARIVSMKDLMAWMQAPVGLDGAKASAK